MSISIDTLVGPLFALIFFLFLKEFSHIIDFLLLIMIMFFIYTFPKSVKSVRMLVIDILYYYFFDNSALTYVSIIKLTLLFL